jgi:ABC-type sugar transport system ATPase subunit
LPPARRDYGIVFQSYALFPNLDVAANIAYGLTGRREDKQRRVSELLALIGLDGIAAKYPSQLSGGQQQRVALARAPLRPRCCCWMNRCRHWMPGYASICAGKSAACNKSWASPPSW